MAKIQTLRRLVVEKLGRFKHQADPSRRPPKKYVEALPRIEACCGRLDGKAILEVGSDSAGTFLAFLSRERRIRRALGINPGLSEEKNFGNIELRKFDVREILVPNRHFDLILSISVLEHVHDLPIALQEMYRVLRPGGYMWAEFGPIWSSCWGHHLWIDHQGRTVNWRTHALPAYSHLLMTESEMRAWCDTAFVDPELSEKITSFVFHSQKQNRLFFSDYERILSESPFETVFIVGAPDLPFHIGYECEDSASLFRDLASRYPDKSGFGYHVVWVLLHRKE